MLQPLNRASAISQTIENKSVLKTHVTHYMIKHTKYGNFMNQNTTSSCNAFIWEQIE